MPPPTAQPLQPITPASITTAGKALSASTSPSTSKSDPRTGSQSRSIPRRADKKHLYSPPLTPSSPSRFHSLTKASAMPTPESAAFLAKKPTVAPTYEGVDFEDNVAVHNARDAIIREQWVRSMMARLVGEELGKCYAREGVNHFEKCGVLREKYFELLKERKVKGYLFQEKNYFGGEAGKSA